MHRACQEQERMDKSILFNDTVANNISFGTEGASIEDIKMAATIANATEFIEQMDDKLRGKLRRLGVSKGARNLKSPPKPKLMPNSAERPLSPQSKKKRKRKNR